VTVNVDNIVFEKPVKLGEIVIARANVIYVGNTSILVRVKVDAEDKNGVKRIIIGCANLLFVAIDSEANPTSVPRPILQTGDEKRLFERGKEIKENLKRLC